MIHKPGQSVFQKAGRELKEAEDGAGEKTFWLIVKIIFGIFIGMALLGG